MGGGVSVCTLRLIVATVLLFVMALATASGSEAAPETATKPLRFDIGSGKTVEVKPVAGFQMVQGQTAPAVPLNVMVTLLDTFCCSGCITAPEALMSGQPPACQAQSLSLVKALS